MGNYISCSLSSPGSKHSKSIIKVIFPGSEIRRFRAASVKAAELMLERPNFFVVNARSLRIGSRFSALNADEELELSNVYVMFPMKRVNSRVTAADMGALLLTANAAAKRVCDGKVKILPEKEKEEEEKDTMIEGKLKLDLEDIIEESSRSEFMHRLSMRRSKKPLLETIAEEAILCSR
ncbi:uncharacterized protein G2W53_027739 [Senna tora]|uniref:DUF4228 domain protein n=1 Tax=Senna tora TaxID=362788 RepID=A0A834TR82_9FABA|nr:uncharacterized protein G2W53_027739 [Senna tora]